MISKSLLIFLTLAWCIPGWSADAGRIEQKRQAESEQTELRKKLNNLKQDINKTESAKHRAEDALANSETAISTTNRKLVQLDTEQEKIEQQLIELAEQQHQLQNQIEGQKEQLSSLLRQQYETGNTDRIKLLLSGDNPNKINRDLQYLGYLSQSQNKLIQELRTNLATVEANKLATEQAKQNLENIESEQQQKKTDLEKEKAKRADLLKELSSKLSAQRKEAGQLQKNEQRLANLVVQLNKIIEEQRKAEQLAKQQAKIKAAAEAKAKSGKSSKSVKVTQTPENDGSADRSEFARLKGNLRLPVKGELSAKFGSQRGEGAVWKGLFIRADEGDNIKSIAPGKVLFADWLRGFGNLIILDHGGQYMSIYGNNQALLKQPGDQVNTGDTIATVGNSGGNEQSGLYFELRYQGKAFDPLKWINLK